jgi:hypothetical protein
MVSSTTSALNRTGMVLKCLLCFCFTHWFDPVMTCLALQCTHPKYRQAISENNSGFESQKGLCIASPYVYSVYFYLDNCWVFMQLTNVFGVILEVYTSCIKTRMSFRVPEQKQYQGNAVINSIQFNSILYYASVSELFMV